MQAVGTDQSQRFNDFPKTWDDITPVVKEDVRVDKTKTGLTVTRTRTETRTTIDGVTRTKDGTNTNTVSFAMTKKQPYLKAAAIAVTGVAVSLGLPVILGLGALITGGIAATGLALTVGALVSLKHKHDARFARVTAQTDAIRDELFAKVEHADKALTSDELGALIIEAQQKVALIRPE